MKGRGAFLKIIFGVKRLDYELKREGEGEGVVVRMSEPVACCCRRPCRLPHAHGSASLSLYRYCISFSPVVEKRTYLSRLLQ
jgi:hypothetical protein